VCFEKKIIIELDGGQHSTPAEMENDSKRSHWFELQGYKVLRFWDNEVLTNIQGVLEVIGTNGLNHPPLNRLPSREGK
jgi:very-short-patch-repair endonuclease